MTEPAYPQYLQLVGELWNDDGPILDKEVAVRDGLTVHLHADPDLECPVVRFVANMQQIDRPEEIMDLAFNMAESVLTTLTDHDACDVVVRVRSGHFDIHEDLRYLELEGFTHFVVDARVEDSLT